MQGSDTRALAGQATADIHQAAWVAGGDEFRTGRDDIASLIAHHGGRRIRVLHRERSAESAAFLRARQADKIQALDLFEQLVGAVAHLHHAQRVAG